MISLCHAAGESFSPDFTRVDSSHSCHSCHSSSKSVKARRTRPGLSEGTCEHEYLDTTPKRRYDSQTEIRRPNRDTTPKPRYDAQTASAGRHALVRKSAMGDTPHAHGSRSNLTHYAARHAARLS